MQYDIQLAVGESKRYEVVGTFFRFKSLTGSVTVTTSKGPVFDLTAGQGVRGLNFTALTIKNTSGAANSGVLLAGDFEFVDSSVVGAVSVLGTANTNATAVEKSARVIANNDCYSGGVGILATGGNFCNVGISNPAGSGKNVIVESVRLISASGGLTVRGYLNTFNSAFKSVAPCTKKTGSSSPNTRLYGEQSTTADSAVAALNGVVYESPLGVAYTEKVIAPDKPYVLLPGYALTFTSVSVANAQMWAHFDFREE
ncbi:hypothetical protein GTP23_12120 [Pseudoduganella sp. FT93W]|uniref:Uncharacterized protein n=1 Tax=Duganella fentianensis TaxID=2692177 RepID=A0A845HXR0_9BURK|nr:hypothetical protein [Duganella fentianensis]MYN45793.1 hypothetical protein [Duganella fentianensis]